MKKKSVGMSHQPWERFNKAKTRGYKKFKRFCAFNFDSSCQMVFKAKRKRARCCPSCTKTLRILKQNQEDWKKMHKGTVTETVEWTDRDNCVVEQVREEPVKDPAGNVLGTTRQITKVKSTAEDLVAGLTRPLKVLQDKKAQLEQLRKQLAETKKLFKTAEMVRFMKLLEDTRKVNQKKQLEAQIPLLEADLHMDQQFVNIRQKTIASRPPENAVKDEPPKTG